MSTTLLSSVFCIGSDPAFLAVVNEAAKRLNPDAIVRVVGRLDAAVRASEAEDENILLAVCDPDAATVKDASEQRDAAALPRWAFVALGGTDTDVPDGAIVPRDEWNAALVAQVFRGALARHRLRRDNEKLRGDLTTYGIRIAHDLRTPLGGMMTTAEMLREILAEENPTSVPLTQPILDSADGLVKLIERMSFFAKATVSRELRQRFDMGACFWNAFQQLEGRVLQARATLKQPSSWPAVRGHQGWLEAVWRNLLANALEHGGPGVRIEAGWSREGDRFRFWLWDDGKVALERRPLLFFPFNRMHEPAAARGLGLAIVRRLVELEGGRCGFEAPAEGGSCFFFTLPVPPEPTAAPTDAGASAWS